jgi:hypothetical protein
VRIVQLVPTLPPPLEGVGTYALAVARALWAHAGFESAFVVGDPAWRQEGRPLLEARAVEARTAAALARAVEGAGDPVSDCVLLHYVNYGYASRGCPFWLLRGLERWKHAHPGRRLVTIFHEVYAFGPPWRSSFWLSPLQRRLARRVLAMTDAGVTSLTRYVDCLGARQTERKVEVLPVFSTVGEQPTPAPLADRPRALVVFGGRGARERAYRVFSGQLEKACADLQIDVVHDLGPAAQAAPAAVAGRPVQRHGVITADAVSALFSGAFAGFLAYPPAFLPKSTIYAAYVAHGVLPVCAWSAGDRRARALDGLHYWDPMTDTAAIGPAGRQAIATAAHAWYTGHSLEKCASRIARMLGARVATGVGKKRTGDTSGA